MAAMPGAALSPPTWAAAVHRSARPLIFLATQLRTAVPADPAETHKALADAVERLERELTNAGCDARTVTAASYLLCVWLDEVIAPHSWAAPTWPASSLLLHFHQEADGRTRVFQLLDRLMQKPDADRPLLELFHVCLSLGLQGRWLDAPDGARQLAALRARLAELLGLRAAPLAEPLSTRWQAAVAERKPWQGRRVAVAGLMLVALTGLGVYSGSQWLLAAQVDKVFASLHGLERSSGGTQRSALAAALAALPGMAALAPARMASALATELQSGELSVRDEPNRSLISIGADRLFQPGTTQIAAARIGLLERVAQALAGNGGRVLVTAYARPDAPRSARLASASQLADEWAYQVSKVLQKRLPGGNVASEGRVAPQDTAAGGGGSTSSGDAGSARNLIEITLYP